MAFGSIQNDRLIGSKSATGILSIPLEIGMLVSVALLYSVAFVFSNAYAGEIFVFEILK